MFNKSGLKNFRRNKLANNFFVPLYTQTREGKMKEIISISKKNTFSKRFKTDIIKFISGENLAFKDYINCLKSKYKLVARNTIPFGYLTYDYFHSELLLFKKI